MNKINLAAGEANAIFAKAEARAKGLRAIAEALGEKVLIFLLHIMVLDSSAISFVYIVVMVAYNMAY